MTTQAAHQRAVTRFPLSFAQVAKKKPNAKPPSAFRLFHLSHVVLENELITSLVFRDLEQIETLTSLNVSGCTSLSQGVINHLLKMPNLRRLDVTGCTLIPNRSKNYLKRKNPKLTIIG